MDLMQDDVILRGGFRGGRTQHAPPLFFCRDRAPDFVWAPQAKRMHQIMQNWLRKLRFFSASERPLFLKILDPPLILWKVNDADGMSLNCIQICGNPMDVILHWCVLTTCPVTLGPNHEYGCLVCVDDIETLDGDIELNYWRVKNRNWYD